MIRQLSGFPRPIIALLAALVVASMALVVSRTGTRSFRVAVLGGRVHRVVDGDTILVEGLGTVRYLWIDTPELHHPRKPLQRLAREARRANARLVDGRWVQLVTDRERRDKYGRLLAYVYVDGQMANAELVCQGMARTLPFWPNLRFAAMFERMRVDAERRHIGLWSDVQGGLPWGRLEPSRLRPLGPGRVCQRRSPG